MVLDCQANTLTNYLHIETAARIPQPITEPFNRLSKNEKLKVKVAC